MLELAEELKTEQSLLVFGRGYNYATAMEAALKVCSGFQGCLDTDPNVQQQAPNLLDIAYM